MNSSLVPKQGPWEVTREQYHADRQCLSNSALCDFRKSVPLFHGRYVTGEIESKTATDAMNLGTALHTAVLEPVKFDDTIAVIWDGIDRRTKEGKADWKLFLEMADGKTIIDAEQYQTCRAMEKAIMSHDIARQAVRAEGPVERPIRWQDAETGGWVRNLIDKYIPHAGTIVDLKTSSDPTPAGFAKSVANFEYHCQAALYSRGIKTVYGADVDFLFVVVGTTPPHEVCCYTLDADALAIGERKNQIAMIDIANRMKTGDWRSRFASRIETLSLPKWALFQE